MTTIIVLYCWAAVTIWFLIGTTVTDSSSLRGVRIAPWVVCAILWPALPAILLLHSLVMRFRR